MKKPGVLLILLVLGLSACGGGDDAEPSVEPQASETSANEFAPDQVAALQEAATIAYEGAAGYAVTNDNYFARDLNERGELAAGVSTALSKADSGVASTYAQNVGQLAECSPYPDVLLARVWSSNDGRSLRIAVSNQDIVLEITYDAGDPEPSFGEPRECVNP